MILPGISGSFILVLLGKYAYILEAVKSFNFTVLLVFVGGIIVGITSFSRVLSFALHRFRDITIAVLSGFMLGSLNKVWPWKKTVESIINQGIETQTVEVNSAPDQLIWQAVALAVIGFIVVWGIDKIAKKFA